MSRPYILVTLLALVAALFAWQASTESLPGKPRPDQTQPALQSPDGHGGPLVVQAEPIPPPAPRGVPAPPPLAGTQPTVLGVPRGIQELQRRGLPIGPPTTTAPIPQNLFDKLRTKGTATALPASPGNPPQPQVLEQPTIARPPVRPTVPQLIEKIRTLPGGPARIEQAKQRGARISLQPPPSEGVPSRPVSLFTPGEANADQIFCLSLTPQKPRTASGTLYPEGIMLLAAYQPILSSAIQVWGTALGQKSYITAAVVGVPPGQYLVNVVADTWSVKASAFVRGDSNPANTYTWDYTGNTGGVQTYYVWLFDLAQGTPTIEWHIEAGTARFVEFFMTNDLSGNTRC